MHQTGVSSIDFSQAIYRPFSHPYSQRLNPMASSTRSSFSGSEDITEGSLNKVWKISILKELQEIKSILRAIKAEKLN
jgi:hypothetical protein